MNNDILQALEEIEKEKGISKDTLFETLEAALISAYKRNFNAGANDVGVYIDKNTGKVKVYSRLRVVEKVGKKHMMDKKMSPSIEQWLGEAKADPAAPKVGMYLLHNGVVRQTPKAQARRGIDDGSPIQGMELTYDAAKVKEAIAETYRMEGIFYVKAWINEGRLAVGDDLMYVLIGGDIRPHVQEALQFLVEKIKTGCVTEVEIRA